MKNNNSETQEIVKQQKSILLKVNKEKEQLLLCSNNDKKYDNLKKNLGWNDTDNLIEDLTRKAIETESIQSKLLNEAIFTNELIYDYCVKNNYVLANIKEYKGQLSEELLEAINNYSISADRRLESSANVSNLFLLCPFSDVLHNNDNIKKSKRYKKYELSKLLLLERISDERIHDSHHYKVIFEIGNRKTIRNSIASIFKTHTKTQNIFNNAILFNIIAFIIMGISLLVNSEKEWIFQWLPGLMYIILITLVLKAIIPSFFSNNGDFSVNMYADEDFKYIAHTKFAIEHYNTSWLYKCRSIDIKNKFIVRKKVIISSLMIIFGSYLFLNLMVKLNKDKLLSKGDITITKVIDDKDYNINKIYKKTGFLTNSLEEVKIKKKK